MLRVDIPSKFQRETMYSLLSSVIDNDLNPVDHNIELNFTKLRFIEPSGITILSNLFEWLKRQGVNITLIHPKGPFPKKNPIQFLDDSGFFERYLKYSLTSNPSRRSTTMPLKLVAYNNSYQWLDNDFTFWLSNQLGVSSESLTNIKISFGEIFNNIRDHAQENTGCIFAQHYPANDEVKIAISDFGIGIPKNVRKIEPSLLDDQALEKATTEGFTTRTTPRNLGAGLHTLIQNVVNDNGGAIHIHSNYGIISCTKGNDDIIKETSLKSAFYPGTFIEVILKTNNIHNIMDIEEEFEW